MGERTMEGHTEARGEKKTREQKKTYKNIKEEITPGERGKDGAEKKKKREVKQLQRLL